MRQDETRAQLHSPPDAHLEETEFVEFSQNLLEPDRRDAVLLHLDSCQRCHEILTELHLDDGHGVTRLSDPLIGAMLGEYRVEAVLARGGMGAVYRGLQPMIGKQVAIKVLLPDAASDPEQMHRLLAEARAVNTIRHPNIIDIFSFGHLPDGRHYFVMELLDGLPLNELLAQKGKLSPGEVLTVLEQALSALGAAHAANVIHRDLKPANLFVSFMADQRWHVTVLDFGLAKRLGASSSTSPNMTMGTPGFMSPEQIRGKDVGPASDLYSMGVVAWVLLAGEEPFSAPSFVDLMMLHLQQPLPSLAEKAPECPPALIRLIERMLEKHPEERPQSATDVLSEVARLRRELLGSQTMKPLPMSTAPTERAQAQPTRVVPKLVSPVAVPPKSRAPLFVVLSLVVMAVVTVAAWQWKGRAPPVVVAPPPAPIEVAPPAPEVVPTPVAVEPEPIVPVPVTDPEPPPVKVIQPVKPGAPPLSSATVEKRLTQARAQAAKIESAAARRMMTLELDRLEGRLSAGEAPRLVNRDLGEVLEKYGVP